MKKIFTSFGILFCTLFFSTIMYSQNLEVDGKAKITVMDLHNMADSVVVVLSDGTLARRDVSTLSEFQILSISNDTIYLTNGSFVKLPVDQVDDADADPNNETQILSISNDTIYLTNGGFVKLPDDDNGGWADNGNAVRLETITDSVGIGTATPSAKLDVVGETELNGNVAINSNLTVDTDAFFVDGPGKKVGIRTATPLAPLHIKYNGEALRIDGSTPYISFYTGATFNGYLYQDNSNMWLYNKKAGNLRLGTSDLTRLFINSGGNVGIGTTTPSQKLDIVGNLEVNGSSVFNEGSTNSDFRIESDGNTTMFFVDANTNRVGIGTAAPTNALDVRGSVVFNENSTDADFRVESNTNTNMLFVDGGTNRVGIGTSAPSKTLDIVGSLEVNGAAVFNESSLDADFRVESNTNTNMLFVDGGTNRVGIGTSAPSRTLDIVGSLEVNGAAVFNESSLDADFRVESNSNSSMLFVNGGTNRVGIGTSVPNATLHVNGRIQFGSVEYIEDGGGSIITLLGSLLPDTDNARNLGSSSFRWDNVWATNGTIQTSDKNLKKDIEEIPYGLNEIMKLNPVRFRWKEGFDQGYKLGLIAQELLPVLSEVVKTYDYEVSEEDETIVTRVELETLGVYYSDIIPVLIKGMQEQQAEIEELKELVNQLIAKSNSD